MVVGGEQLGKRRPVAAGARLAVDEDHHLSLTGVNRRP
jgi:hypothetical protein